ncbi:MAG: polyprenyl synthetase family protein [Clostridia bacterium]|nr:polyprenyl synthetase family protein [Clostridia bacterium]
MTARFDEQYEELRTYFNAELEKACGEINTVPEILGESMKYSLQLGGKRIRPVLMYAVGDAIGVDRSTLTPFACALEFIHTYSLIHDDLPEMDNDDFRRGKPSNHKVFGTANAVLAGDGLLNTAYSILLKECFKGNEYISAASFICESAGIHGMIAGQSADILHENDEFPNEDVLEYIYEKKTAKLLIAAVTVPSVFRGGAYYSELKQFGKKLGYLFQLTDDILDASGSFDKLGKTTGKDEKENKLTAVKLYGLDECRLRADVVGDDCHKILDGLQGGAEFLHGIVNFVKARLN